MPIELHAFDTPNGRKISVALEEMALPDTVKVVDLRKRQQVEPEFLKISPGGKIPAIVDPDGPGGKPVCVVESGRCRDRSIVSPQSSTKLTVASDSSAIRRKRGDFTK